ncbi:MAG: hypothetical protein MI755_05000, partial [Sphingomonadales bacterium]|nr:hypothetical protein [Sphingomonadales bacterium]
RQTAGNRCLTAIVCNGWGPVYPANEMEPTEPSSPPTPVPPDPLDNRETYLQKLNRYLMLTLSIPERAARALGGMVGGTTLLLCNTLLPNMVRNSSSYHFTMGMFQSFLVRNLAGMREVDTAELQENFVHRKMVGTGLEAAGLLTMHLSPVWVFAIASDAAKGGKVFLQRLVSELKDNGVIDPERNPESLEQILQAIDDVGHRGATAIDTPPMSMQEISDLASELRTSVGSLAGNSASLLPRFEEIWDQISAVAKKENLSREQVLGMLSVSAASIAGTGFNTAGAVSKTGYAIVDEVILTDYKNTLGEISEEGALSYMNNHMRPFVANAQQQFDFRRETWTQRKLGPMLGKFFSKLRSGKP